jgi:hypothetical protein
MMFVVDLHIAIPAAGETIEKILGRSSKVFVSV